MSKKRIAIVMGGPSAENEISLLSGREVLQNCDRDTYDLRAVVVTSDKQFYYADIGSSMPSLEELTHPERSSRFAGPAKGYHSQSVWAGCDAALLAMHGAFGEDGVIQGYLDTFGLPYTGSGVYASAVAMNKIATKIIFERYGLHTPPYSLCGKRHPEVSIETVARDRGFPCFVKCPQSGSSRLMGRAQTLEELKALVEELSNESDELLVESAISGIEFSCPVLHLPDGSVKALPPIEIRPKTVFFDFTAKYTTGASEELVPAPRPSELLRRIEEVAIRADAILGCKGISRTDMILQDDVLYVLEINTLPGMTPNSLAPKSFKAQGGTYPQLLDILIQSALHQ